MRICLLHYSSSPVIGGVETIIAEHARLMTAAGHRVTIISREGSSPDPSIAWHHLPGGKAAETKARLRQLLAGQDALFMHNVLSMPFEPGWTEALWELADVAQEPDRPRFIAWIHDLAAANPDYQVPADSLLRKAHPNIDYVAVSALRRTQFRELTGADCQFIPNGIDPASVLDLSAPVAKLATSHNLISGRQHILLHPTRILARKNIELGLHTVAALRDLGEDYRLLITAPPDPHNPASARYADLLKSLRTQLALEEHVLLLHDLFPVGPADLASLYRLADALFLPSFQEGFGLPILEAGLFRIPVFCSAIAPFNTMVEAPHRFPPDGNPAQIALLIRDTLRHNPLIQTRKSILQKYAWPIIWQTGLAPLLQQNPINTP